MIINRSAPRASVVPVLVYQDVGKAVKWLCDTLGFRERLRHVMQNGSVTHAQLDVGECTIMLGRQGGEFRAPFQPEVSQYTVEDPEGHRWTFSQSVADVAPEAWGAVLAQPLSP